MMRVLTYNQKFLFCYKKDLQLKYSIYDETIKQYAKVGNDISPALIKTFVLSANPKISRQQNYMPKVNHILKSMLPHFRTNANFYANQGIFSSILVLYSTMNIHRKLIFDLIQQKCNKFEKKSLLFWFQIYSSFVDLHHQSNIDFKIKLKNFLLSQLLNEKFSQKNSPKIDHFQISIKTLKLMLMDRNIDIGQCQTLLSHIESKILPKMQSISLIDRNIGQNLAFLNELVKLQEFKLNSDKFKKLLEEAKKFQISQKIQSQKSFVKRQNYQISLKDEDFLQGQGSTVQQNKRIINHGQSSVFETIFSRILQEKGYDFQKNVFIGIFEYDLIVKGKKQKIYRPFQNSKGKDFKPISLQQWNIFKNMNDFKKIKVNEKLENPVVLNLNGPYHYIDSDVYGQQKVTRTDQMKGKFLKNYGYTNFNMVHHAKWQQIHEKGIHVENYIEQLISQNLLKNI